MEADASFIKAMSNSDGTFHVFSYLNNEGDIYTAQHEALDEPKTRLLGKNKIHFVTFSGAIHVVYKDPYGCQAVNVNVSVSTEVGNNFLFFSSSVVEVDERSSSPDVFCMWTWSDLDVLELLQEHYFFCERKTTSTHLLRCW